MVQSEGACIGNILYWNLNIIKELTLLLSHYCCEKTKLTKKERACIFSQVAHGLEHIHNHGIMHGDIGKAIFFFFARTSQGLETLDSVS